MFCFYKQITSTVYLTKLKYPYLLSTYRTVNSTKPSSVPPISYYTRRWWTGNTRNEVLQWLFIWHLYSDLHLPFTWESEDFIEFLCNYCWLLPSQTIIFTFTRMKHSSECRFFELDQFCVFSAYQVNDPLPTLWNFSTLLLMFVSCDWKGT